MHNMECLLHMLYLGYEGGNDMKKWAIVSLLLCTLLITGCSKNNSSEAYNRMVNSENEVLKIYDEDSEASLEDDLKTLQDVMLKEYVLDEITVNSMVERPAGIAFLDNSVLISDEKNDCVIKCTTEGKEISRVGKTGSAPSEFISPTAIDVYKDSIYILDTGNKRIQIIDKEMNYIDSISLESDDPKYNPQSLAVNEDGIYVGGVSLTDSVIGKYSHDGNYAKIGTNFVGSVSSEGENVYAINSMSLFYDKENDSIGAVTAGPDFLFELKNGSLDTICELPKGFNLTSFEVNEEEIIAISSSASAVFKLGMDGQYKETLTYIDGLDREDSPIIKSDQQGRYYVCLPLAGRIYRLIER